VSIGVAAGPASAQPQQNGLVNLNISGNTVQVPVGVAANVCNVSVNVLATLVNNEAAPCDASADPDATVTPGNGGGGAGPQSGLVNVNVSDNTVQVPVAVAANVCNVSVDILVSLVNNEAASCTADASSRARG